MGHVYIHVPWSLYESSERTPRGSFFFGSWGRSDERKWLRCRENTEGEGGDTLVFTEPICFKGQKSTILLECDFRTLEPVHNGRMTQICPLLAYKWRILGPLYPMNTHLRG